MCDDHILPFYWLNAWYFMVAVLCTSPYFDSCTESLVEENRQRMMNVASTFGQQLPDLAYSRFCSFHQQTPTRPPQLLNSLPRLNYTRNQPTSCHQLLASWTAFLGSLIFSPLLFVEHTYNNARKSMQPTLYPTFAEFLFNDTLAFYP